MAPRAKIESVDHLEQMIAELRERVTALEAGQCRCTSCKQAAEDRERNRIVARAGEFIAMPAAQRNVKLAALRYIDLARIVKAMDTGVVTVAIEAPEELRALIMREVRDFYTRRRIELTLNPPPARVHVARRELIYRHEKPIELRERAIPVDKETAQRLRSAGLRCTKASFESGDKFSYIRPELYDGRWTVTADQMTLMLAVDTELRGYVEAGHLVMTPVPPAENILLQIQYEDERRSVPQVNVMTPTAIVG